MSDRNGTVIELDEERFVGALIRWNGLKSRAFRETFPDTKGTDASIHIMSTRWSQRPGVVARLAELRATVRVEAEAAARDIIARARSIVEADASELTRTVVHACRHCWGDGHRYQFTAREYERRWIEYARDLEKAARRKDPPPEMFEDGGVGYSVKNEPNPDCPECGGHGHARVVITDTRRLSPSAAVLYAGSKRTKNGIEVMAEDRSAWAEKILKAAGVLVDRRELSGPNGGPIPTANLNANVNPEDAARAYADMVKA